MGGTIQTKAYTMHNQLNQQEIDQIVRRASIMRAAKFNRILSNLFRR